ncbi:LacI family DNA-binding transcriptional regulator [Herbiconiux sp. A18JL235]|uniref:LacI family DNA-binding transcriptional regulator n=1 Tax=Herbiconiux sp. A18JL235 TaxID=3152363 RepID=A0AB39BIF4_9MICO
MNHRARVGLTDVADAAGVSKSTASRALRGESRVSAETIEHVLATAARLGYVRDRRAAELASSAPTTVGLLLRGAERSFYGEIAARVQAVTDARGIDLLIVNGGDDHAMQMRALDNLLGHRVAGIMIASGRASLAAAEHAASFVPTVLVGLPSDDDAFDSVSIDAASEIEMASQVFQAGHRRVALTAGHSAASIVLQRRTDLYREALESLGATVTMIPGVGIDGFAEGFRSALDDGATAIMAGDDPSAVAILETLDTWGVPAPQKVSVTGFDGVGVYRSSLFGLATMRQPVEEMAVAATDIMMRRLDGTQTTPAHETFRGEFIAGTTLASPHRT